MFVVGFLLSAEVSFSVGGEAVRWFRGVWGGCGVCCAILCARMLRWVCFAGNVSRRQREHRCFTLSVFWCSFFLLFVVVIVVSLW